MFGRLGLVMATSRLYRRHCPRPNSSRLTSLKSTLQPTNNVGRAHQRGCATNSYSSISSSTTPAGATPPASNPHPTPASAAGRPSRSPRTSSAFQSTRSGCSATRTSLPRDRPDEGFHQSGSLTCAPAAALPPSFRITRPKRRASASRFSAARHVSLRRRAFHDDAAPVNVTLM
jgi:hypothetical protein